MIERPNFSKKVEWFSGSKKDRERGRKIEKKEFDCGCIFEGEFNGSSFRGNVILCEEHLLARKQKQKEE